MLNSFDRHLTDAAGDANATAKHFTMNLPFNVPADKLYKAFATKQGASNWWSTFCEGNDDVGGTLHFRFPKAGFFAKMKILRLEQNRLVEWECIDSSHPRASGWSDLKDWVGTRLRFHVSPEGDSSSSLKFEHVGLTPVLECHGSCSSTWAFYLTDSLRSYLEQGAGKAYTDDSENNIEGQ